MSAVASDGNKGVSPVEGGFVLLLMIWGVSSLLIDKLGSFGPIVTQENAVAWIKFIASWCWFIAAGLSLARGIYLIRAHGFKLKESMWLGWGIFMPIVAVVVGVMTLDMSRDFLERKLDMRPPLEHIMNSNDVSEKWETTRFIARMIFLDTGERPQHMSESGKIVTFEPSEDDLMGRKQMVETRQQLQEANEGIRKAFVVWGGVMCVAVMAGFVAKVTRASPLSNDN